LTLPPDPTTLIGGALLALVQCPPVVDGYTPREQASPSALQQYAACRRSWGERYLHGRRETSLEWEYARQIPEPPKPVRGMSALAKVEAEDTRKAWNKVRRPALGTDVHDILQAYMVQNCPRGAGDRGAWHPPMRWREVDWTTQAGRIARPAADVLPDPRGLVAVHTELAAEVSCLDGSAWVEHTRVTDEDGRQMCCNNAGRHWPKMPGFYDLVTVERSDTPLEGSIGRCLRYRLWDYKTTSNFDWAKTAEELAEDPQVLLYSLHAMQTWGLDSIECNWVYLLTDPERQPKSYVVTVTITRADAERAVLEMAETAAEVCSNVRLFAAGRLRVVELEQDVSACKAYGGCIYHVDKRGPCDARVSPGKALKQKAELEAKIKARKSARKEAEMALSFEERKKQRDAAKAAGTAPAGDTAASAAPAADEPAPNGGQAAGADAVASGSAPAGGAGSVAEASAASSAATAKLRENRPKAVKASAVQAEGIGATVDGFAFDVPAASALGKQLAKAAKGLQAAAAAFEGE
jgi:hypothetical protein